MVFQAKWQGEIICISVTELGKFIERMVGIIGQGVLALQSVYGMWSHGVCGPPVGV